MPASFSALPSVIRVRGRRTSSSHIPKSAHAFLAGMGLTSQKSTSKKGCSLNCIFLAL